MKMRFANTIQRFRRRLRRSGFWPALLVGGLLLPWAPLAADLLHMKNGDELEGFYVREADGFVEFKMADGTDRKIPADEVKRLELGYTGVPLCYSTRAKPEEKVCNVLLHEIRDDKMIIADQKGYTRLRSIDIYDVGFAELNRVGDFQKIAPLLTKDLKVRATRARDRTEASENGSDGSAGDGGDAESGEPGQSETGDASDPDTKPGESNGEDPTDVAGENGSATPGEDGQANQPDPDDIIEGSVAEIRGDRVLIRDENGELREIEDGRIQLVAFQGPPESERPRPEREFRYSDLYPGIPQLGSDQRMKGYGLFGGFHFALFAVLWEFRAAQEASAAAAGDPTVLLFNNTSYLEQFERHQRNQMMFGIAAGLVYAWHLVDWFYFGDPAVPQGGGSKDANRPAIHLDGYQYQDGEYREEVYRVGLQLRF